MNFNQLGVIKKGGNQRNSPKKSGNQFFEPGKYSTEGTNRPVSKYTPYIHHTAYINSLNTGQKTRQPLPYLYKPSYLSNRLRSPSPELKTKMVTCHCKPTSERKKDEDGCIKVAPKIVKPQQHAIMKSLLSDLKIGRRHEDTNSKKIKEKSKMFDVDDYIKNKSMRGKRPTVRFHPSVGNPAQMRTAKNKTTGKIETESEYFLRHCDGSNSQLILNPDHPNVDVIFSNESLFKHDQSKETVCSEMFYEPKSNNTYRKQKNNSFGICDRNDCFRQNSLKTSDSFVSRRSPVSPTYCLTDIEDNNGGVTETNDSFIENSWDESCKLENKQNEASKTFQKYQTFHEMKRNTNPSMKNDWEKIGIRENSLDRNISKRNLGTVPRRPHTSRESCKNTSQNRIKENCSNRNYKSNANTPRECINVFARLQKSEDIIGEVTSRRFSNEEFEKTSCEEYTIDIKGRRSLIGSPVIHKGNHRTRVMQVRKSVASSSSNEDNNTKFESESLGSKSNENTKTIKMQNRKYSRRNIERKNSNISTSSSAFSNSAPPSPNFVKKRSNIRKIGLLESSTNLRRQFVNEYPLRYYNNPEPKLHSNQDRDDWQTSGNEEEIDFAKVKTLPKETKTAMLILMDEKKSNSQASAKKILHSTKTQTSPLVRRKSTVISINILSESSPENSKIRINSKENSTCPYDLLCNGCDCSHLGNSLDTFFYDAKNQLHNRQDRVHPKQRRANSLMRNVNELTCMTWIDNMEEATMNGMNGHHTNGELNGCGGDIITQNQQKGCWTIGLINSASQRYLTAETFGFKINANGVSLKKKQIWTLEPINGGTESFIYLRSHLEKYLAVDSFGNVTCESDEKDPGTKFQISVSEDGTGRWALRNVTRGYFLGSSADKLTCTAKVPGNGEFWHVHLAARPQINLRSVGRKRFAHLSENLDEIHVDANIPWGEDTLFTLEFRFEESGKYAIHTCNNKYLSRDGKLSDTCTKNCLFSAEYHSGQLALRDCSGAYLSPIGSKAVLKTRSQTVTKDELFSLEDSLPQASFVAALNSRYVSVKQGVDVTANQDEISDHETFQLEFDWSTKRWYIRTMQDRYWTLETGGGIQAAGDKRSSNALFDLIWQGDGSVCFRANNGKYVMTKRSGHLYATAEAAEENCKYFFYLINRPILVLKCEQGFVGYKSASSPKLECNKATYETIQVERSDKGVVFFKGQNGKYWHVDGEGVTADSDTPEGFYLELREPTRICIKSVGGQYLAASKNGMFRLGDSNIESATQWEY